MRLTLESYDERTDTKVSMSTPCEYLPDILNDLKSFLLACGFVIRGNLEVVEDPDMLAKEEQQFEQ